MLKQNQIEQIQQYHKRGFSISQISRELSISYGAVRKYLGLGLIRLINCGHCGKKNPPSNRGRKYCSSECRGAADLQRKNNWSDGAIKLKTQCRHCLICFEYRKGQRGLYCSIYCSTLVTKQKRIQAALDEIADGTKRCRYCNKIKSLSEFSRRSLSVAGYSAYCKSCSSKKYTKWISIPENKERKLARQKSPENRRRERQLAESKRGTEEHAHKLARERKRRKTDPSYRLSENMRNGIKNSLRDMRTGKTAKNGRKWTSLVPYDCLMLKRHIEKQFQPGMTWDNYGEWHIDHKIPISAFNFTKPEDMDFQRCWALKNLQPMWASDNLSKNNKLHKPFQPALAI